MSSTIDTTNLKAKDLKMLDGVLAACGYTGTISGNPKGELNVAAKLIIRLFRQGLRQPAQLADALYRNFDRPGMQPNVINFPGRHREAVQGITPKSRVH
ncbi:hypothetical protein FHX08_005563 [Rhizobium sp. BK529]|uniref:hypothetical protein n=1 Tax=Rhizobium sp. BK529 TaxID=2586983 RepID=UPI0016192DD6|nr:hypothetical protein [Rhizobium sp. BK529]MBB3595153.1 hypothetical protein [Rhizobium sp. BK529]